MAKRSLIIATSLCILLIVVLFQALPALSRSGAYTKHDDHYDENDEKRFESSCPESPKCGCVEDYERTCRKDKFCKVQHCVVNVTWEDNNHGGVSLPVYYSAGYHEIFVYTHVLSAMSGVYNTSIVLGPILWMTQYPTQGEGRWEFATLDQLKMDVYVDGNNIMKGFQGITDNSAIKVKGPFVELSICDYDATIAEAWVQVAVDLYFA